MIMYEDVVTLSVGGRVERRGRLWGWVRSTYYVRSKVGVVNVGATKVPITIGVCVFILHSMYVGRYIDRSVGLNHV